MIGRNKLKHSLFLYCTLLVLLCSQPFAPKIVAAPPDTKPVPVPLAIDEALLDAELQKDLAPEKDKKDNWQIRKLKEAYPTVEEAAQEEEIEQSCNKQPAFLSSLEGVLAAAATADLIYLRDVYTGEDYFPQSPEKTNRAVLRLLLSGALYLMIKDINCQYNP